MSPEQEEVAAQLRYDEAPAPLDREAATDAALRSCEWAQSLLDSQI